MDISNIIDSYNENGVFIRINSSIYWFNEKRLEELYVFKSVYL